MEQGMMNKRYRQISATLRVQRGPGHPDLVSSRPFKKDKNGNKLFTDSDAQPTLVEFDEHCQVDVPQLLKTGAIATIEEATDE